MQDKKTSQLKEGYLLASLKTKDGKLKFIRIPKNEERLNGVNADESLALKKRLQNRRILTLSITMVVECMLIVLFWTCGTPF